MLSVVRLVLIVGCSLTTLRAVGQAAPTPAPGGWVCQGRVLNASRRPVLGASVWAKGTHEAATTNSDGFFRLALPAGHYLLLVDYPGHLALETPVGPTDSTLTITVHSTQPRATRR